MADQQDGVDFALAAYREEGVWQVQELAHDVLEDWAILRWIEEALWTGFPNDVDNYGTHHPVKGLNIGPYSYNTGSDIRVMRWQNVTDGLSNTFFYVEDAGRNEPVWPELFETFAPLQPFIITEELLAGFEACDDIVIAPQNSEITIRPEVEEITIGRSR